MTLALDIETIDLKNGGHEKREEGVCAMELVAWMAGEPHSDHPQCASPVIGAFLRNWNDSLRSDEERNRLIRPLLRMVIGTAIGPEAEERRAWIATDWLVRECAPAWLDLAGLHDEAAVLRSLAEIHDGASADACSEALANARERAAAARDAAGDAAGAAARDAAGDATRDAAWAAARAAARDAARDAARAAARDAAWDAARDAARAAARDAAWDAAWDAARDAARAAAWDALTPTVERLQQSAQRLVVEMCEVGR